MHIGVCDDRQDARDMIAEKIRSLAEEYQITTYASGEEVLEEAELLDILFLDIRMPGLSGMETARRLREAGSRCALIFVTAIEDCVFEAFDVDALHYLVKPFSDEKLREVLQKAIRHQRELASMRREGQEEPSMVVTAGGEHMTVRFCDIVYAEVFNRKVALHMRDGDIEYYGKLKDLEKKAGDSFCRTHRAYLVNFRYVRKYDAESVTLERGKAPIARQVYSEFVKRYLRYNRREDSGEW